MLRNTWNDPRHIFSKSWMMAVLLIGILAVAGCGDDDDPASPTGGGNGGGGGNASVTASINGEAFTAVVAQAVNNNGIIGVGSSTENAETTIGFGWIDTGAPTYSIEPGSAATGTVITVGGSGWQARDDDGSGTINVTTLTSTRVAGTFSFTAVRYTGTETPIETVVTNGKFDVEF